MYGQNICNTRSAPTSDPINATTVSKLKQKWAFTASGDISMTPAVVGGQVYVGDWGGTLYRLDGATGSVVWQQNVGSLLNIPDGGFGFDAGGMMLDTSLVRGFTIPVVRATPAVAGNNIIVGVGAANANTFMAALNKDTGTLVWETSVDTNPVALITGSPAVEGNIVYVGVSSGEELAAGLIGGYPCCSFRGSVVALDATTGTIKWKTPMIEDSAYYAADGVTLAGFAGAAIWSGTPTIDRKRKLIYATTGNLYKTPAGAAAPWPAGVHAESIVALDLETGAIKWAQRMEPAAGDIWTALNIGNPESDYDFGGGANLFQATINGVSQDLVGAGQKSGAYWALNPDTGAVVWMSQVGPGGHLGGIHWGTAADQNGIYVGVNDETGSGYTMGGMGSQAGMSTSVGSWAALDLAGAQSPGPDGGKSNGKILWQIANPSLTAPLNGASVNAPLTVSNGVLFAGSMDAMGTMYALDTKTGNILWQFQSGATVYGGPAISNGVVYWGSGYPNNRLGMGTHGTYQLYAFDLGN